MSEYRCVEEMLVNGRKHQVGPHVREVAKKNFDSRYVHIFLGLVCQGMGAAGEAIKSFEAATAFSSAEVLPDLDSPATRVYVETQLQFPAGQRSCDVWAGAEFIDLWGRLHFYNPETKQVLVLAEGFGNQVHSLLGQCLPLAMIGMVSGQELPYILDHQVKDFLLGRKRIIYWFEEDLGRLRGQLCLRDFSAEIGNQEIVLFGGKNPEKRIEGVFGSYRYPPPQVTVGDTEPVSGQLTRINKILDPTEAQRQAEEYYRSSEFSDRLRRIAAGEMLPRVLGSTCRWTTFLQYCVKDFLEAFKRLGCETSLVIEENDVQCLTAKLSWKMLSDFRPDLLFSVSHTRPSFLVPAELPVVGFLQDKCGPVAMLKDLGPAITARDFFVCMSREMRRYLVEKNVPADQCMVMPIPSDERMFYPLSRDLPGMEKYSVDVGFVKHADPHGENAFANFVAQQMQGIASPELKQEFLQAFTELYRTTCQVRDGQRHYVAEMEEFIFSRVGHLIDPGGRFAVSQLVTSFYTVVFANTWRYQFIEGLDTAGIKVGLYGNGWEKNAQFRHLSRGPVDRGTELNKVYNFNKINLNIHPGTTMHQRVCECALAGGFMLDSNHSEEIDYEPIRPYFEPGREIILFDTVEDLVEKCRYYLGHPEERRRIADQAYRRALAEQTTSAGAEKILGEWRAILRRSS
jgi:spore maturation protein CgeB